MISRAISRLRAHLALAPLGAERARHKAQRNYPVLYVPGIFGTKLHDRACRTYPWGDYRGLLFRQAGEAGFDIDLGDPQRILANETLHEFRIVPGIYSSIVTRDVVNALEVGLGYRLECDLFFLAYDWRQDYRRLGRLLELEIQRLQSRFGEHQKIILIGQSVANTAIRHWLRSTAPAFRESIAKWYAFGPPWRGSWNAVHMLQHGHWPAGPRYHGFSAEAVGTCPSVYQLLPVDSQVVDRHGDAVEGFDIFDATHWADAGLPHRHAGLAAQLAQAKDFATATAGEHPADYAVPQTWFVNDANQAVSAALKGESGEPAATTLAAIRQRAPDVLARCLETGDDHFPLRHVSEAPCGPLVASPEAAPWGDDCVIVSQARDHRALINHGPNLRALVKDIAAFTATAPNEDGFSTHVQHRTTQPDCRPLRRIDDGR
jgi:hypothetical protein